MVKLKKQHYFYGAYNCTDDLLQFQMDIQKGYNATNVHGFTTVSFVEGHRESNLGATFHPSALSPVVRELKRPVL